MTITDVQIKTVRPQNGLVAFATIVIDGSLRLNSIAVYQRLDGHGWRLTYPTKRAGLHDLNIYHPLTPEASEAIEQAIFDDMKEVIESSNDRYNRAHT